MTSINTSGDETSFQVKVSMSVSYMNFKKKSDDPQWTRIKNEHMNAINANNLYVNPVIGSGSTKRNEWVIAVGIIGSTMSHDTISHKNEFIKMVKEQINQDVNPNHIKVQVPEIETPTSLVDMIPSNMPRNQRALLTQEQKNDAIPEKVMMQVISVKNDMQISVATIAKSLKPSADTIKYPTAAHCKYVDIRTEAYDTRNQWVDNVMMPQFQYYHNRHEVLVMGVPSQVDFKTYVPKVQLGEDMNEFTIHQLLTGAASLGQRREDQSLIPPCFIKVSKGRDKGSYILEGRAYQQHNIKELCENYLLGHLQHWLHDAGGSKTVYIRYSPTRNAAFEGTHGYPISTIPDHDEIATLPSIASEEMTVPIEDKMRTQITGTLANGLPANNKDTTTPNHNHLTIPNNNATDTNKTSNDQHDSPQSAHDGASNRTKTSSQTKRKRREDDALTKVYSILRKQTKLIRAQGKKLTKQNERIQQLEKDERKRKRE
jgi:hypothetical protein